MMDDMSVFLCPLTILPGIEWKWLPTARDIQVLGDDVSARKRGDTVPIAPRIISKPLRLVGLGIRGDKVRPAAFKDWVRSFQLPAGSIIFATEPREQTDYNPAGLGFTWAVSWRWFILLHDNREGRPVYEVPEGADDLTDRWWERQP